MRELDKDEQKAMHAALLKSVEVVDEGGMSALPACSIAPWINVDDRLPDTNAWYLVYSGVGSKSVSMDRWQGEWFVGNVTHWMPLPEPPVQ